MKVIPFLLVLAGMLTARVCPAATNSVVLDDPEGRAIIQRAQQIIAEYHTAAPKTNHTLRVVYFIPKDSDGLPNYAERIDRIMNDVSDFYRDGLRRFGLETSGLPLERKDGKLVLHVVHGKLPAKEYSYDTGGVTKRKPVLP